MLGLDGTTPLSPEQTSAMLGPAATAAMMAKRRWHYQTILNCGPS